MPLNLDAKKQIVEQLHATASSASSAVLADYLGVEANKLIALRAAAREQGVSLTVVRNTLARRAFADTDFACLQDSLQGPCLLAFSTSDPGAGARLLKDFAADNEQFTIKALSASGQLYPASAIDKLAKLPTREQALAQLASTMQAPMAKLVRGLNDLPAQLARTLEAIRAQKAAAA